MLADVGMVFVSMFAVASSAMGVHEAADTIFSDHATSPSPSLGVTAARAGCAGLDEHERAGLLTSESSFGPALPLRKKQWHL